MSYASFDGQATIRDLEDFRHPLPMPKGKPRTMVVTAITVTPSGTLTLRGYDDETTQAARCLSDITATDLMPATVAAEVARVHQALRTAEATIKGGTPS